MKQMQYLNDNKMEILYSGIYKGRYFCIVNICGHHPCAYIEVKESFIDIEDTSPAHYGFTYADTLSHLKKKVNELTELDSEHLDNFFLGWDYAHWGDYTPTRFLKEDLDNEKKWTTEEIFENVVEVIEWANETEFEKLCLK